MGWGAGLLGEAFGGFFIADMVSDPGSYDVGFDDVDGFDFSSVITEIVGKKLEPNVE